MGGVLFTLEVILLDFSVRAFTPIVSASVVAYVTTQAIFRAIDPANSHAAIFSVTQGVGAAPQMLDWQGMPEHGRAGAGLRRGGRRPDPADVPLRGPVPPPAGARARSARHSAARPSG